MNSRLDIARAERFRAKLDSYLQLHRQRAEIERQLEEWEADPDLAAFMVPSAKEPTIERAPREKKAPARQSDRARVAAVVAGREEDFDGRDAREIARSADPELAERVDDRLFSDHLRKLQIAGKLACVKAGKPGRGGWFPRYRNIAAGEQEGGMSDDSATTETA